LRRLRGRPTIDTDDRRADHRLLRRRKSTIAAGLARRGLAAIDADGDPLLARFVDTAGNVVEEEPAAPDLDWLSGHSWAWDPGRLDELIRVDAILSHALAS
jgi:hypothetical protein